MVFNFSYYYLPSKTRKIAGMAYKYKQGRIQHLRHDTIFKVTKVASEQLHVVLFFHVKSVYKLQLVCNSMHVIVLFKLNLFTESHIFRQWTTLAKTCHERQSSSGP